MVGWRADRSIGQKVELYLNGANVIQNTVGMVPQLVNGINFYDLSGP